MTAIFPFLPEAESKRRALAIESLVLDGKTLDAQVSSAIKDIPFERTIEGASTVSLVLADPYGELLDSGLFSSAVDIELPGPSAITPSGGRLPDGSDMLGYRLVRIRTANGGTVLTLEFEDREVAAMRAHKEVRKASRADQTRAEFIRTLVRAVRGVRFWSPELHTRQPIASVRDTPTKAEKTERRDPGFGSATPKVKDHTATREQIRLLEQALETAVSLKAGEDVLIGLVEAMTQESVVQNDKGNVAGITGGHRENIGVLHQDERYWPASRNVPRDVTPFITRLIDVRKSNRSKSIGWCVDQVQRSYTVTTAEQGKDYDQWESEARDTVSAYTGNEGLTQGTIVSTTYRQRYEFRTTEPGADHREDWWSAAGRLASEVNFRRFVDYGVFHYVSDDYLRKAAPRLVIERSKWPDGVASVDVGDFDTGKPRRNRDGQNVGGAEVRVEVLADVLDPPIGGVWILKGYGPCDGRYLITSVRGSYLSPRVTVTMSLPVPKLPEPAPEIGTRQTETLPETRRSISGGNLADAYAEAKRIHEKRYPYVWGGGHARAGTPDTGLPGTAHDELTDREHIGFDCSGAVAAVLKAAGYLPDRFWGGGAPVSGGFARWGEAGEGRNLTVWYNDVHVFIEFRNMTDAHKTEHWGTGRWGKDWGGPGFNPNLHPHAGFSPRHWATRQAPTTTVEGHPVQQP